MRSLTALVLWCLLLVVAFIGSNCTRKESHQIDTLTSPITASVEKINVSHPYYLKRVLRKTDIIYAANNYEKIWLKKTGPTKNFKVFVEEVKQCSNYGMNPQDYHLEEIEAEVDSLYKKRKRKRSDPEINALDIRITASFFLFTTHLLEGRIRNPGSSEFIWKRGTPHEDDVSMLMNIESASDLRKQLAKLHPQDIRYKKLQHALNRYVLLVNADTLPEISLKKKLKPGESHEQVPLVRKKIALTDLKHDKETDNNLLYDEHLAKGVMHFQKRHGLSPDGILDEETVAQLNVPIKHRAEILMLNLERLRWSPKPSYDDDELVVNVPEYALRIYDNGKETLSMKVVLGAEFTATPVFTDTIRYIVFNPSWYVPKSIIEKEIIPNLVDDPAHYSNSGFTFFKNDEEINPEDEDWEDKDLDISAFKVVQNPGDGNSLGKVKFVMPNHFSIYLHDTPADQLFSRSERALSHGCVRVEKPEDLAAYLLKDEKKWDKKKIVETMKGDESVTVNLKKMYPVHIVYRTAWADDDGVVNFRRDVYGHDKRQLAQLKRAHKLETAMRNE